MSVVQIAPATDRGVYYYDLADGSLYHVPRGELPGRNHVRLPGLFEWLAGSLLAALGVIHCAKDLASPLSPVPLLAILVVSGCLLFGIVRAWQNRMGRSIQERYRPVDGVDLDQVLPGCRGTYGQLLLYLLFLALFALISFGEAVAASSLLFSLFAIVFFDVGAMVLAILQPIGKLRAYAALKRNAKFK